MIPINICPKCGVVYDPIIAKRICPVCLQKNSREVAIKTFNEKKRKLKCL
jgi:ribosomal protein L32